MPGFDVHIIHEQGHDCSPGEERAICIRLPLPPGTLPTLWHADDRYEAAYVREHPGYYLTGDGGHFDKDGYRRDQRAGATRAGRRQGGRVHRRPRRRPGPAGARRDRRRGRIQVRRLRPCAAEDALGNILRKTMRGLAAGRDEPVPSTIEDPAVLDALAPILRG